MPGKQYNWHRSAFSKVKIVSSLCIAFALCLLGAYSAWASSASVPSNQVSLQVNVGLNAQSRSGYWFPVWVTINNASPQDISGTVSLRIYSGLYHPTTDELTSRQRFEQPVSVPHGQTRQVLLHIPF